MGVTDTAPPAWPALPLAAWQDTYATLHMWTQIVGKVCLALTPRTNHFWNITFRVTSRGLATPLMTAGGRTLTAAFDFMSHELRFDASDGSTARVPLARQTVADFHRSVMDALQRLRIDVRIWTMPVEVPDPVRFEQDVIHHSYDPAAAGTFLGVLTAITPVLERFRCGFSGKCSPVHFFWGSFDLAVTRFSGRRAPERPGADPVTREAYSHEVISHGWWPGGGAVAEPAFYAYAAPEPEGLKSSAVAPAGAYYDTTLSEFILPYEAVRTAASPERELMAFFESTYARAADLARWHRSDLERS